MSLSAMPWGSAQDIFMGGRVEAPEFSFWRKEYGPNDRRRILSN